MFRLSGNRDSRSRKLYILGKHASANLNLQEVNNDQVQRKSAVEKSRLKPAENRRRLSGFQKDSQQSPECGGRKKCFMAA